MNKIFDFSDVDKGKTEETLQKTWNEFRQGLAGREFLYSDIDNALQSTFLHVFDDLFQHGHQFLEVHATDILTANTGMVRAARINPDALKPDYDRFLPKAEFITKDNRFSPPGVEWLYLAFSQDKTASKWTTAEMCALKECRAKKGERFALCQFKLTDRFKGTTLVDLTIAKETPFEEINKELEQCGQEIADREIVKGLKHLATRAHHYNPQIDEIIPAIIKWMIYTYAKLLSEQIFLPITTEDRNLMYAPFQCMAQYFLSKGYNGIVYSSTVFPEGKNVVLFDKLAAYPHGEIKELIIPADF